MKPVIRPLLQLAAQLRVFHWQTASYAEHTAFGSAYEAVEDLSDRYVEALFGRYERLFATSEDEAFSFEIKNYSKETVTSVVDEALRYFKQDLPVEVSGEPATDLANIRDDMVSEMNKLRYLLTLK